jgi:hypothetical protein
VNIRIKITTVSQHIIFESAVSFAPLKDVHSLLFGATMLKSAGELSTQLYTTCVTKSHNLSFFFDFSSFDGCVVKRFKKKERVCCCCVSTLSAE